MKHSVGALVVLVSCCASLAATAGCSGDNTSDASSAGRGSSGGAPPIVSGSTAGTGPSHGDALPANAVEVALLPSSTGVVNGEPGVIGAWYAYGDGNDRADPGVCQTVGMHMTSECSVIDTPTPGTPFEPGGASSAQMCTSGTVARLIPFGDPPVVDYSNIFGAGIGLDLNNPGADGGTDMKLPFDATSKKVIGISFDLDFVPPAGLRVEFPFGTASTPAGIWRPNTTTFASPLSVGHNVLLFENVLQPAYVQTADLVPFDASTLTSIQFHVPTTASDVSPYHFCIDNLALIVQM